MRKFVKCAALAPAQGDEASHARLAQTVQQNICQRRGSLAVSGSKGGNAVHKVQSKSGVLDRRIEVIVPSAWAGGGDRDLLSSSFARRDQLASPTKALDHLVSRIGAGNGSSHWFAAGCFEADDRTRKPIHLGLDRSAPFYWHLFG